MRDRLKNLSVSFVLLSVLYVLLGLVLLIWPATVMDALCYLTGGILLLYGVISIVGFCREEMRTAGSFLTLLLGIVAAKNRGKWLDSVICCFANIGVSMPMFWLGMMGMLVFALRLRVLPSSGYVPMERDFTEWLRHMVMPIIVMSLGVNASILRLTRSSMLEVMRQDYVTTARAKGVSRRGVTFRHQLRNSLIPIVTYVSLSIPYLFTGSLLLESFFGIPGLGSVSINAINSADMSVVRAVVIFGALIYQVVNLLTDIAYGWLDPRVRFAQ